MYNNLGNEMDNRIIYVYTDGACQGNQVESNSGGYAAFLKCGKYEKTISGGEKNTTNNIMEMKAVIEGLALIKDKSYRVVVLSDSAYVVNCMNDKWYVKWQARNWMITAGVPVKNKELWQRMLELVESFSDISFIKIKGHLDRKSEAEKKKWYDKLDESVKKEMSFDDYLIHIDRNVVVDGLASAEAEKLKED